MGSTKKGCQPQPSGPLRRTGANGLKPCPGARRESDVLDSVLTLASVPTRRRHLSSGREFSDRQSPDTSAVLPTTVLPGTDREHRGRGFTIRAAAGASNPHLIPRVLTVRVYAFRARDSRPPNP